MLQKLFTFLILTILLLAGVTKAQVPPDPTLGPGEKWTNLWSVSYDYQTNGSVRYLVQDPANPLNWCAILMAQQDSNTAAGTGRYIYFSYSEDGGNTWAANILDNSNVYGFPCMTLSNGLPVIAAHKSSALGTFVFKDVLFGGFSFTNITGVPTISGANQPIWPHIVGTTNGNLVICAAPNDGSNFFGNSTTNVGAVNGAWSPYSEHSSIGGPSGNFDVASGPGGKAGIIGYNYVSGLDLTYFSSSDNGVTFDAGTVLAPYIIDGSDTLYFNIAGGYQSIYDNAGNIHIFAAAYNAFDLDPVVTNTARYVKPRIYQWTQAGGFIPVAGKFNIPTLTDTLTTALMAPVTQPSVTISTSGRITCSFTAFLYNNKQVVDDGSILNAGEIFVCYSDNNGVSWSTPVNVTNTPNIEEKHSSLAPKTNTDSLRLYYVRDLKAGGWVNVSAWGKAPVYGIFKTMPLSGIKENLSVAKTYELMQNYPNPFNPTTLISYNIQKAGLVTLKVYDMLGREVTTLVNEVQSQGPKEITFNGANLTSGIYYYSITTGDFKDTKKMMLIK